jgi:protein-disulfide isomerase
MTARRIAIALAIAPLTLGLAACNKSGTETAAPSGKPIANIAPPAGKLWSDVAVATPDGGYQMGNPQAPIKLVEFGALSCSHCAEFSEKGSAEIRDSFVASGRVSYELRFMMNNFLDVPAVLLATCGSTEAVIPLSDQFWGWQKTMFDTLQKAGDAQLQAATQLPPEQRFVAIAAAGGMDQFFAARGIAADQGKACLADAAKATKLASNTTIWGEQFKIEGTPTFMLNGLKLDGNTWEAIKADLEKAGAR